MRQYPFGDKGERTTKEKEDEDHDDDDGGGFPPKMAAVLVIFINDDYGRKLKRCWWLSSLYLTLAAAP